MIVVDTSVWSRAFRRRSGSQHEPSVEKLRELIRLDADVRIPGVALQELLSGVRHDEQFSKLRRVMRGFPVLLADEQTHVRAARIYNDCVRSGVAATSLDCLIAAHASEAELLTADGDFEHMAEVCELTLHKY